MVYKTLQIKLPHSPTSWKCLIIMNSVGCKEDHQSITGVGIGGIGGAGKFWKKQGTPSETPKETSSRLAAVVYRGSLFVTDQSLPLPHNNSPPLNQILWRHVKQWHAKIPSSAFPSSGNLGKLCIMLFDLIIIITAKSWPIYTTFLLM